MVQSASGADAARSLSAAETSTASIAAPVRSVVVFFLSFLTEIAIYVVLIYIFYIFIRIFCLFFLVLVRGRVNHTLLWLQARSREAGAATAMFVLSDEDNLGAIAAAELAQSAGAGKRSCE